MPNYKEVFSSFSVDDLAKAKQFYAETLGLTIEDGKMGLLLQIPGSGFIFIYPKENHLPATFTILNLEVDDIDGVVKGLVEKGVEFERYEGIGQDEQGISRGRTSGHGPDIAWFKDPAGNILAVLAR